MTNEQLRALCLAATPGPWKFGISSWGLETTEVVCVKPFDYDSGGYSDNPGIFGEGDRMVVGCDEYDVFRSTADKAYLTAMDPTTTLRLLDEMARLRGLLRRAEAIIERDL